MKKIIQIMIVCVLSLYSHRTDAQQYYAWTDTLSVRIADSVYLNGAIEFDLQIYRPNKNWEAQDTILGDADFCFNYSEKAFSPATSPISFGNVNSGLTSGSLLSLGGNFISDQWIIIKTVLTNSGAKMLPIPLKEWVTLCRVKIGFSSPAVESNMPGIVWDKTATGMMTAGGRPIYLKLLGDVKKHPDPTINLVDYSPRKVMECEGENVLLFATGNSSGDKLKFKWECSKSGKTPWTLIGDDANGFNAPQKGHLTIQSQKINYTVLGVGDTIVFENASAVLDSMFFQCTLSDASLPSATSKTTPNIQMLLRDSLWGFLDKTTAVALGLDTVTKCPSSENVSVNFWLYGFESNAEFNGEIGRKIHFSYYAEDANLTQTLDTIDLSVPAPSNVGGFGRVAGKIAYFWNVALPAKGNTKIWINKIWTDFCQNGTAGVEYDTLYIKEVYQETFTLPKVTVEPGKLVALTPIDHLFDDIKNLQLGTGIILDQGSKDIKDKPGEKYHHFDYSAIQVGKDTVIYSYAEGQCTLEIMREVEVVDKYYLTMRVLLQGAYVGLDKSGKDTMRCVDKGIFTSFTMKNGKHYVSPYADALKVEEFPKLEGGGSICDWIYIMLRDGASGSIIDSTSAFLRQDGRVFNLEGKPFVTFSKLDKQSYYVIIKHRNHVPVMSRNLIKLIRETPTDLILGTDFTNIDNIYGSSSLYLVAATFGLLYAGDVDNNDVITSTDQNIIDTNPGLRYLYDVDHSKTVTSGDANYVRDNNGRAYRFPKIQ